MKGCNHIWEKLSDGSYHCIICGEISATTPKELIKQSTLGDTKDPPTKK